MNDALVLHWVCSFTLISGEVCTKVIELGPWDNRGVILSVSIKCLWASAEGGQNMFGRGAKTSHRGGGVLIITNRVALKESTNKSIGLDPEFNLINIQALKLIKNNNRTI